MNKLFYIHFFYVFEIQHILHVQQITIQMLTVFRFHKILFYFLFLLFFKILLKKKKIYLFMIDIEREAETQAEGEAGSMQGAGCGTRSRDPGITPWAKDNAKPLSHPGSPPKWQFHMV